MISKLSSDFVGEPRYPVASSDAPVIVKYSTLNKDGQLLTTTCNPDAVIFDVVYKLKEDNSIDEVNINFDHNTMREGVWYKVKIAEGDARGFMIKDGELLQVRYSD